MDLKEISSRESYDKIKANLQMLNKSHGNKKTAL